MKALPRIDRRAWLVLWLQRRRHGLRTFGSTALLEVGLSQFYLPQSGAAYCKSWNETESLASNPFDGLAAPIVDVGSGNYAAGNYVQYVLLPYRGSGGQRVYAGALLEQDVSVSSNLSGLLWPAWSATPGWVTGFAVMRTVNSSYAGFRDVTVTTMLAGWLDDGNGWSSAAELPCDFDNPPATAKALWNLLDHHLPPQTAPVVASPFGGWAFDSNFGDKLVRFLSDDLRRNADATMAYWVCPTVPTGYNVLSSMRGSWTGNFGADYSLGDSFTINGTGGFVEATGHQDGDWYLAVFRNDSLDDSYKMDLLRMRDLAHFTHTETLAAAPLTDAMNYIEEGIWGVLVYGSSFHWGVQGYGYYDRMGVWDRALDDDEVLGLFNNGLGWQPG